jgi:PP-loop superfamily ATP-utilizing enzyme
VQHVPTIIKNLVSDSLLGRDNFKVVLTSNKFIVSNHGQFLGKCYGCRHLFHFSISEFYNNFINYICDGFNESDNSV